MSKRFVVGYIHFGENSLEMVEVPETYNFTREQAFLAGIYNILSKEEGWDYQQDEWLSELEGSSVEDIRIALFDADSAGNVLEVTPPPIK